VVWRARTLPSFVEKRQKMKSTLTTTLFVCLFVTSLTSPADAQQGEDYCGAFKMLLQSAKDGFAQARNFKMAGASVCNVETDTRSYGCMWTFDKSALAAAGYQKALQAAHACFPNVTPRQSRSQRGTIHTEYDFGKGEPLIDISRGKPGSEAGDWYSIDIVAP
jgi:hypothetical protein